MGMKREGFIGSIAGALVLAGVSTAGDYIWEKWLTHKTVYGVTHGAVMCLCIGLVLGWGAGRGAVGKGALGALITGAVVSGAFYPLYSLMGSSAMFLCWGLLWLAFALIYRFLRGNTQPLKESLARGMVAAIGSGVGFYPMFILWTKPPENPSYLVFFLAWTLAFLPGFLPLLVRKGDQDRDA